MLETRSDKDVESAEEALEERRKEEKRRSEKRKDDMRKIEEKRTEEKRREEKRRETERREEEKKKSHHLKVHIEEKSKEVVDEAKKPLYNKKRRFKPIKSESSNVKKEETKKRLVTRLKTTTTNMPTKKEIEKTTQKSFAVKIDSHEDIIDEVFKKVEDLKEKANGATTGEVPEQERSVPDWLTKERRLSVPLIGDNCPDSAKNNPEGKKKIFL